ncbi:mechanosensitive ion channel family protein [Luteimonas aquatica]|uniref:mechanosensitive ion channel family protein n=1 Tax=Luteimonas aquatica TaxID=450364 RepID=UPI001F56860D|nr:mechanosensitive ion channel family protein [Luteimonas aquatica]
MNPLRQHLIRLLLLCLLSLAAPVLAAADPVAAADAKAVAVLRTQLAAAEGLKNVTATVEAGVARLDGTVLELEQRKQAGDIATAVPGVTSVQNAITLDSNLHNRFLAAYEQVTGKLLKLLAALPLLVFAALIVLAAVWLGRFLARRLHWLRLRSDNPYMNNLVRRTIQTVTVLVGILLALDLLGATSLVGALLGSAGLVGLALGFAFKDIAENYIAGILLSMQRPFSPGEHVKIDAYEGKIVALTSRATLLLTLDGNQLRLPNALVFKSVLLNYSQNPNRRFEFVITIDGAQSIREAQTLGTAAMARVEGVLVDPAPSWVVVDYTPNGTGLRYYGWVDQRVNDLGKVRSEAIRAVKAAYARAGIESPRTVYHVVTSRERGQAEDASAPVEPLHDKDIDTSVNTDIDDQLAAAQRADEGRNMLEPGVPPP